MRKHNALSATKEPKKEQHKRPSAAAADAAAADADAATADSLQPETARSVLQAANKAQDETNRRLQRLVKGAYQMRDQQGEIIDQVAKQSDQVAGGNVELNEMATEEDRAAADVLYFFRNLDKQKMLIVCCVVVVLLTGAAVGIGIYEQRARNNASPVGSPSSSTTTQSPTLEEPPSLSSTTLSR